MEKETIRSLLEAFDGLYKTLGFDSFDEGIDSICTKLEDLTQNLEQARTREAAEKMLEPIAEPEPAELLQMLAFLKTAPYLIRRLVPQAFKEAMKQFPHDPGGRPRALTPEQARDACKEIGQLVGRGLSLGVAIERIGQRMGVSPRTVQRAWHQRGALFAGRDELVDK